MVCTVYDCECGRKSDELDWHCLGLLMTGQPDGCVLLWARCRSSCQLPLAHVFICATITNAVVFELCLTQSESHVVLCCGRVLCGMNLHWVIAWDCMGTDRHSSSHSSAPLTCSVRCVRRCRRVLILWRRRRQPRPWHRRPGRRHLQRVARWVLLHLLQTQLKEAQEDVTIELEGERRW